MGSVASGWIMYFLDKDFRVNYYSNCNCAWVSKLMDKCYFNLVGQMKAYHLLFTKTFKIKEWIVLRPKAPFWYWRTKAQGGEICHQIWSNARFPPWHPRFLHPLCSWEKVSVLMSLSPFSCGHMIHGVGKPTSAKCRHLVAWTTWCWEVLGLTPNFPPLFPD